MAAIKGVKEKVHLPIYDSFFVGAGRQLREIATSGVLKFFVNVNGKTRLETNMQAASLLPHWNTFEARAMRVVVSDLPPKFPPDVEQCLRAPGPVPGTVPAEQLQRCIDMLSHFPDYPKHSVTGQQVHEAWQHVSGFKETIRRMDDMPGGLKGSIGVLRNYGDTEKMKPIFELQRELKAIREPLLDVLKRTKIGLPKNVTDFADRVEKLDDVAIEKELIKQIKDVKSIADAFEQLAGSFEGMKQTQFDELDSFFLSIEGFLDQEQKKVSRLKALKDCLNGVLEELKKLGQEPREPRIEDIIRCLNQTIVDKRRIPIDEQLTGNSQRVLSKLIYNSVVSFIVGEKTMMQMPMWFFPAGAGPFSEDGKTVTHGFPSPEATFRFAEPIFIDAQQNFRVEIEIPDAVAFAELQRVYGPLFLWVTLDGYMSRDVQ